MSETTERETVLAGFMGCGGHICEGCEVQCTNGDGRTPIAGDMADEIVRLRQRADRAERILAALREQSEAVVGAAARAEVPRTYSMRTPSERARLRRSARAMLRAAVAAAEREVDA